LGGQRLSRKALTIGRKTRRLESRRCRPGGLLHNCLELLIRNAGPAQAAAAVASRSAAAPAIVSGSAAEVS
jgi:hypothetical protein